MSIENIQEQIKTLQQRMNMWPTENTKAIEDRNQILSLTDTHFNAVENDLQKLLEQCKMLPTSDQITVAPNLKELQTFVQNKFLLAEKELIEVKSQMTQGRHYVKAIKAYTKA